MGPAALSDEELLAGRDAASFERFYCHQFDDLLAYFARRTRNPELAADLTAETFAAALAGRRRYRPEAGPAGAWLFGIASNKLADAQRRGHADMRARRRLGMERLELADDDLVRIESYAGPQATVLVEVLVSDQRDAVKAHVVDERAYADIARDMHTTEAVVRKRVSRGLLTLRKRMGVGHER
jgi:RNA polymerase sigma factor (sigma-70 family)